MIEAPAGTAWYVYGVAEDDPALERLPGIEVIRHGTLAAIVREVPLDEYDEAVLPERLNDREWLERNARAHEDVLQSVAAATTVVPLRFGTIYRSREHVGEMLGERTGELTETIERVRGRVELGVKAWIDLNALARTLAAGDEPAGAAGAGAAYLQQRAREQERARELEARCAGLAEEAHRRLCAVAVADVVNRPQAQELTGLCAVAVADVVNRPQAQELTGRPEAMLLNGAYLVPDGDDGLRGEVERLAAEHAELGVEYELTGPWPPHNFTGDRP